MTAPRTRTSHTARALRLPRDRCDRYARPRTTPSRSRPPSATRPRATARLTESRRRSLRRAIPGRRLILLGRVLVPRRTLGEERGRHERAGAVVPTFHDNVHAVRERVRNDSAVRHGNDLRAIGHGERNGSTTWIPGDRSRHDARAHLHARVIQRRIALDL